MYSDVHWLLLICCNLKNTGVIYLKAKHVISTPDLLSLTYGLYLNVFLKDYILSNG